MDSAIPLRASITNRCGHPNTWCNNPFFPTLTRVVVEEAEVVAGDAAVGVTQIATGNNNLLNDIYPQIILDEDRQHLQKISWIIFPSVPHQRGKRLSVITLHEREKTPCFYTPLERVKISCFQTPQEEVKIPCLPTPPEGKKTLCFHTPQEGVKTPCVKPPPGVGGGDPFCTVSWCIYPRSSSKTIKPTSGKQTKGVPVSMENLRRSPLNTKPHRRIQTTLQGASNLVQDTMHHQRLRRLQQTKRLVNLYSRLATQMCSRDCPKTV